VACLITELWPFKVLEFQTAITPLLSDLEPRIWHRWIALALPSRTQSLKAAIVYDRDVTVKASSKNALNLQNSIKTVKFLVSTLLFSRTMCLGFTITASWSKMPLMMRKLSFTSEVKFVYLLFLRNFYFVNHLNNTKSQQMLFTS
jgi:hypothetical protein